MRQEPIPQALAVEGGLMRKALVDDLLAVPGVEPVVLQDDRLSSPGHGQPAQTISIPAEAPFQAIWLSSIQACDAVWPIAPETGGLLERLCLDVENAGKVLLTSPAAAVRLAASKSATASRLAGHGLAVVPTVPIKEPQRRPFVIKPDDGAGCEGSRIVREGDDFPLPTEAGNWIAQPFLEGEALSLSALFAQGKARLLSVNRQVIEQTATGFILKGCHVNAHLDPEGRWQHLAGQVAQAVPELWGYAGIDLILGQDGPVILEINPRLTTSYAGLHQATGENPASRVLELWKTGVLPTPRIHPGIPYEIVLEKSDGH